MSGRLEHCPLAGHPRIVSFTKEDLLFEWLRRGRGRGQGPLQHTQVQLVEERTGLIDRPGSVHFGFDRGIGIRGGESDNHSLSPAMKPPWRRASGATLPAMMSSMMIPGCWPSDRSG